MRVWRHRHSDKAFLENVANAGSDNHKAALIRSELMNIRSAFLDSADLHPDHIRLLFRNLIYFSTINVPIGLTGAFEAVNCLASADTLCKLTAYDLLTVAFSSDKSDVLNFVGHRLIDSLRSSSSCEEQMAALEAIACLSLSSTTVGNLLPLISRLVNTSSRTSASLKSRAYIALAECYKHHPHLFSPIQPWVAIFTQALRAETDPQCTLTLLGSLVEICISDGWQDIFPHILRKLDNDRGSCIAAQCYMFQLLRRADPEYIQEKIESLIVPRLFHFSANKRVCAEDLPLVYELILTGAQYGSCLSTESIGLIYRIVKWLLLSESSSLEYLGLKCILTIGHIPEVKAKLSSLTPIVLTRGGDAQGHVLARARSLSKLATLDNWTTILEHTIALFDQNETFPDVVLDDLVDLAERCSSTPDELVDTVLGLINVIPSDGLGFRLVRLIKSVEGPAPQRVACAIYRDIFKQPFTSNAFRLSVNMLGEFGSLLLSNGVSDSASLIHAVSQGFDQSEATKELILTQLMALAKLHPYISKPVRKQINHLVSLAVRHQDLNIQTRAAELCVLFRQTSERVRNIFDGDRSRETVTGSPSSQSETSSSEDTRQQVEYKDEDPKDMWLRGCIQRDGHLLSNGPIRISFRKQSKAHICKLDLALKCMVPNVRILGFQEQNREGRPYEVNTTSSLPPMMSKNEVAVCHMEVRQRSVSAIPSLWHLKLGDDIVPVALPVCPFTFVVPQSALPKCEAEDMWHTLDSPNEVVTTGKLRWAKMEAFKRVFTRGFNLHVVELAPLLIIGFGFDPHGSIAIALELSRGGTNTGCFTVRTYSQPATDAYAACAASQIVS